MPEDLILKATRNGVTTLTMNNPRKLNGWTSSMMAALKSALTAAASDSETKALVLTGTDPYYCAGVNLGATMKIEHPKRLHAFIVEHNQALFEAFINFSKPILIAVNGPAIGASVTSATLCDGIIASEKATFSTPFAKLAVPAEGCSSVMFPRRFGASAERILGDEGWKPTGEEAHAIGMAQWVVPHGELLERAQAIAEGWVESGRERTYIEATREELLQINARESRQIADAFLSPPFLDGQFRFLWAKKKRRNALIFLGLRLSHPLWSRLL